MSTSKLKAVSTFSERKKDEERSSCLPFPADGRVLISLSSTFGVTGDIITLQGYFWLMGRLLIGQNRLIAISLSDPRARCPSEPKCTVPCVADSIFIETYVYFLSLTSIFSCAFFFAE